MTQHAESDTPAVASMRIAYAVFAPCRGKRVRVDMVDRQHGAHFPGVEMTVHEVTDRMVAFRLDGGQIVQLNPESYFSIRS